MIDVGELARAFFERVRAQADQRGLLSDGHFTVDGTLIDAWASLKSFKRKDVPPAPPDDPRNPQRLPIGHNRQSATEKFGRIAWNRAGGVLADSTGGEGCAEGSF